MTQEEINILWQKAMQEAVEAGEMYTRYRFAKLIAEKEREACAKIVEENANRCGVDTVAWMLLASNAQAIRARENYQKGQTD
jgi:hypothetical protein